MSDELTNGIYVSTSRSTPNENASGWDYSMTSEGGVDTTPMNITKRRQNNTATSRTAT